MIITRSVQARPLAPPAMCSWPARTRRIRPRFAVPSALATCLFLLLPGSTSVATLPDSPWPRHVIDDTSRGADGVRLADVNGDSRRDLVTGWEEGGQVRVYLHPGPEAVDRPWPMVTVGQVGAPEDAVFADLDGDGALDVVSCCEGRERTVFVHWSPTNPEELLDGRRWITDAFPRLRGQQLWMYACPVPAVHHGGSDLVLGSKGPDAGIWRVGSDQPTRDLRRWSEQQLRSAGWIMSLVASDLDHDLDLDLVLSDRKGERRGAYWLQNPGRDAIRRGTAWPEHPIGAVGKEAMFLTVADVDRDGLEDVVIMTLEGHLEYCRRTETGFPGWQSTVIHLPEGHVRGKGIGVGDIDGDQRSDLVITTEDGCVAWRRSAPDPLSANAQWFDIGGSVGYKFDRLELWDLDEDGDLDLLTCEERDNLGVVWYENLSR